MADEQAPMIPSIKIEGNAEFGEFMTGTMDLLMTLGVALANAGLIERQAIADAIGRSLDQLTRQSISTPARRYPMEVMRAIFSAPLMEGGRGAAGLVPIEGGKKDPPDDPKGAA
ncbi:MAG TPA: hypothetical protein VKU84_12515 [Stellaceae bacterium]|nr:hypothetical protein [Stellaceae bacterium]